MLSCVFFCIHSVFLRLFIKRILGSQNYVQKLKLLGHGLAEKYICIFILGLGMEGWYITKNLVIEFSLLFVGYMSGIKGIQVSYLFYNNKLK